MIFKNKKILESIKEKGFKYLQLKNKKSGFTLLEMMLVLAIFGILTAILMYNYGDFNGEIVLSNTAYEMALQIRESQVFTLGVRGSNSNFDLRYGVEFNKNHPKQFIYFSDQPDGGTTYACNDDGGDECVVCESAGECVKLFSILRGIQIDSMCASNDNNVFNPNGTCLGTSVDKLSITFQRPEPDAIIYANNTQFISAGIILKAPSGSKKAVIIRSTGQLSVEDID